jgi:photosystem I P700 chlorophyll a apoprotein A2
MYHIGWTGNFELWKHNPYKTIPIAHNIFDPHFGSTEVENNVAYSGLYNLLASIGISNSADIFSLLILTECLAVASILLAAIHLIYLDSILLWMQSHTATPQHNTTTSTSANYASFRLNQLSHFKTQHSHSMPLRLFLACYDLSGLRLNFHIGAVSGVSSILWAGHIIHVALPSSRGLNNSRT